MSHPGARGHADDFHAYTSVNRGSFCALRAAWKRQFVNEMMIQLQKNEALVMEINQFNVSRPPADEILDYTAAA